MTASDSPPEHVLSAFEVSGPLVRLAGGRGRSWRAGRTVLKPLDGPLPALAWQDQALRGIRTDGGFRIAAPVRSADDRLVVSGWTAWPYLDGRHEAGRWLEIMAAGRLFHAATGALARPSFLDRRTDWWAVGDRVAWDESPIGPYEDLDTIRDLAAALRPVAGRPQVIHGDLTGNLLFHQELPAAVIDVSPYWRPPAFADAIVVADALCWEGAGPDLVDAASADVPDFGQYLLRALIYRIVTDRLAGGDRTHDWQAPYRPAVCAARALTTGQDSIRHL